jgi:hypothetical protein
MTATLTTQELAVFQEKLSAWYDDRSMFILNDFLHRQNYEYSLGLRREEDEVISRMHRLAAQFQKQNPKPDWRTLF